MGGEDILCVYASNSWRNELAVLRSKWPERIREVRTGLEAFHALDQAALACVVVFPDLPDCTAREFVSRASREAPDTHFIVMLRVPERAEDDVVGEKGNIWLYQRSCQRESDLWCFINALIRR